jgi:hypothetical protein
MALEFAMNIRLLVIAIVLILSAASNAGEQKPSRIPTLEELATTWVGEGLEWSLEYYRLDLQVNGEGSLVIQYLPHQTPVAYRVRGTTLNKHRIALELQPLDGGDVLRAHGFAVWPFIELEISSKKPEWRRAIRMQRHSELLARLEAVSRRAKELNGVNR